MNAVEKSPNYEEIFRYYYWLFRVIGVIPTSSSLLTYLLRVYFFLTNLLYYVMYLPDGIRMLLHNDLEIDYVFEAIFVQSLSFRFLILYRKRRELERLLLFGKKIWQMLRQDEVLLVKTYEKKVRFLMHYFVWTTLTGIIFCNITAQMVKLPPAEVNGTERRILPLRFFVEVQEPPWYEITLIFQDIICLSMTVIILAIETIGPFIIMMACGYLKSNNNRLLAMAENTAIAFTDEKKSVNNGGIVVKELRPKKLSNLEVASCVKFHQMILDFCQKIKEFTSILFLIQVMCTVYNISLVLLKILEQDHNVGKNVSILLLNLQQFFTSQWIPQHLLNESKAIANAAYTASLVHPEFDHKANHALLFMMLRAHRPVQITAGGYINLSLETFQRMFMSALSFFTVLRSIRE